MQVSTGWNCVAAIGEGGGKTRVDSQPGATQLRTCRFTIGGRTHMECDGRGEFWRCLRIWGQGRLSGRGNLIIKNEIVPSCSAKKKCLWGFWSKNPPRTLYWGVIGWRALWTTKFSGVPQFNAPCEARLNKSNILYNKYWLLPLKERICNWGDKPLFYSKNSVNGLLLCGKTYLATK